MWVKGPDLSPWTSPSVLITTNSLIWRSDTHHAHQGHHQSQRVDHEESWERCLLFPCLHSSLVNPGVSTIRTGFGVTGGQHEHGNNGIFDLYRKMSWSYSHPDTCVRISRISTLASISLSVHSTAFLHGPNESCLGPFSRWPIYSPQRSPWNLSN